MTSLRRRVGFFHAVGSQDVRSFATPEVVGGLVIGVGGSMWLKSVTDLSERQSIVTSYLGLAGGLLGIVFAALALVVGLFSNEYLRVLDQDRSGDGIIAFLSPFVIAIGLQVTVLVTVVAYGAAASHVPSTAEIWAFGIISTLFFVAALDVVALARSVVMHGVARSKARPLTHPEDTAIRGSGAVRSLGDKR